MSAGMKSPSQAKPNSNRNRPTSKGNKASSPRAVTASTRATDIAPGKDAPLTPTGNPTTSEATGDDALIIREERDFYLSKLRDLEVLLDDACTASGNKDHTAVPAHQIRAILYASNDTFMTSAK
eukprot:CAMPEP_0171696678 /NCGR_PEP_ID=MMETSP0991-20121206/8417_1 /TAXON_ID=483369 /ORGANISM="non described non described, Strain CCMP2098" /LENGTH=123 /DNA_ID=CAMNT_0012285423 /DNA_START=10 /DNA_END=381 /DNA_ORIENTATION=-